MVHDYMCENHSCVNYDRTFSTLIFDSLLKVSDVCPVKRFMMKNSVNIFQNNLIDLGQQYFKKYFT